MVRVWVTILCSKFRLGLVRLVSVTDGQTDKFFDTIYKGYADFFFQLNLLPPYLLCSQDDLISSYSKNYVTLFHVDSNTIRDNSMDVLN